MLEYEPEPFYINIMASIILIAFAAWVCGLVYGAVHVFNSLLGYLIQLI